MAEFMTVKAKKVQVGDTLTGGTYYGHVVTDVAHQSGQVVITAKSGRREFTIPAHAHDLVDIYR